jgi:D-threo-aldose 1-dehydrogenase
VVLRKNISRSKGATVLFDEIRYFFFITTYEAVTHSPAQIVELANERCDQENIHGQLKSGLGAAARPINRGDDGDSARRIAFDTEGAGYTPMFRQVSRAILAGRTEHPLLPHGASAGVVDIVDHLRVALAARRPASPERGMSMEKRRIGARGPEVSTVCLGGSPLGGMPEAYGHDITYEAAISTVSAFLDSSLNFIDTSNEYSRGESERRIGDAITARTTPRSDVVIASKADPLPGDSGFDARRVHASFRESCDRLGVERLPVFYLHDPERFPLTQTLRPGGALAGARELKADGLVDVIGVAGGSVAAMHELLDTGELDVLLCHNQFNLLDRSADALIDHAIEAGVSFVNAAPFATGLLAKPLSAEARFQYGTPSDVIRVRARWLHAECARFGVQLAAVALQLSTRDPRITSTVVGASSPARVRELEAYEASEVPGELWTLITEQIAQWAPTAPRR